MRSVQRQYQTTHIIEIEYWAAVRISTGNGRNDFNIAQVKIRETEISPNNNNP